MTSQQTPRKTQQVQYKGEDLDAARGPGLGCFWLQLALLAVVVVLTPLSAMVWDWPAWATGVLFVLMLLLLLLSGQTVIFLLRIVAASRDEGRRRPLASATRTVGELEDAAQAEAGESAPAQAADGESAPAQADRPDPAPDPAAGAAADASAADPTADPGNGPPAVRQ